MRQENGTPSLDLPAALAEMLMMDPMTSPMPGGVPQVSGGMAPASGVAPMMAPPPLPQYQLGGAVGPGGMPMMPMGMEDDEFDEADVAAIQAELIEALQTGEVTAQDLNLMIQAITVAEQNPQMYLAARNLLIQRDLIEPEDIPEQYDPEAMAMLSAVADVAQQALDAGAGQGAGTQQPGAMPPAGMQSLQKGGPVAGVKDAPVPIMAHEGEYVIPKNVVAMKGREFFDRMIEQYKDR